jgi:hypothetical protein
LKKPISYILACIILIAAGILVFTGSRYRERTLDERMSFSKKDKIPYGAYVAYEGLKYLFLGASVSVNTQEPGYWDSLSNYDAGQALIIVSPVFYADEFEMKKMIRFAENGNDVFVSSAIFSEEVKNILNCGISYVDPFDIFAPKPGKEDSLKLRLAKPPFPVTNTYRYPGKRFDTYFYRIDTAVTTVLGTGRIEDTNFVHLKAGQGNLYFHLAPMAFTNYFLLHDKNLKYYTDMLSVISPATKTIVWDEYYLHKRFTSGKRSQADNNHTWLSALFQYDAFKWGILTAILTLLLYVLLEMRRKQRFIPVITKPRNDSLDFVKTIGRLYYDKGDHKNLCRKMSAYFLEHVRNRYKLSTTEMNEEFVKNLQFKTGVDEAEIQSIVFFIRDMENSPAISDQQLGYFHKQLESFYQKV